MRYTIDCEHLLFPDEAHEYLARVLQLPAYYGRNLDALYDCLTEKGPCTIVLAGTEVLRQWGGYGARVLAAIEQAANANPGLELEYDDDAYPDTDNA